METKLNTQELENELRSYWKDERMVKHCMKHSKYIKMGEWFLNVCEAKPTITTTIWYDDETDGPANSEETFMVANGKGSERVLTNKDNRYYLIKNYCGQTDQKLASILYCRHWEEPTQEVIRELTSDDLKPINAAIAEVQADFNKRLETYYKRYADKISVRGYWVNR